MEIVWSKQEDVSNRAEKESLSSACMRFRWTTLHANCELIHQSDTKNAQPERKMSKSVSVTFALTSAEALEPDFSDKPAPIRCEWGMIVLNPPLLSLCGYFFVFLTRRGWQHRRRGSRRFPRWVIFIALTHLSMSVYWFFHAPVSLCFPEKCLKKKRKRKRNEFSPLTLGWDVCNLQVASALWVRAH